MLGLAQNCAVSTGIISGHWPLGLLQGFNSQLHHFSIKIILKDVSLFLMSDPFYFPVAFPGGRKSLFLISFTSSVHDVSSAFLIFLGDEGIWRVFPETMARSPKVGGTP